MFKLLKKYLIVICLVFTISAFVSKMIIEPPLLLTINYINEFESEAIPCEDIRYEEIERFYLNEEESYCVEISHKENSFQMSINNSLKEQVKESQEIKGLYRGVLGFYFIKN